MTSPLRIREDRVSAAVADSVLLKCPLCDTWIEVRFPYGATPAKRTQVRHDVISNHARVCVGGTAEVERVYTINYPRA